MRQMDITAKRGILQELLNNHSFRSRDFDRCYEASLLHDGGRINMYGETVFTGRTYSERVKPFVSLIAAHYGHGTPDAFFATGLESQDLDIRRRATYVILEGTPSSSKTALQARILFAAFLSGGGGSRTLKGACPRSWVLSSGGRRVRFSTSRLFRSRRTSRHTAAVCLWSLWLTPQPSLSAF